MTRSLLGSSVPEAVPVGHSTEASRIEQDRVIGITTGEVSGDEIQSLGGLVVRFSSTLQWLDASDSDTSPYIVSPGEQLNMRLSSAREGL